MISGLRCHHSYRRPIPHPMKENNKNKIGNGAHCTCCRVDQWENPITIATIITTFVSTATTAVSFLKFLCCSLFVSNSVVICSIAFFVVCMCVYVFTYALFCTVIGASAISSSRQSGRPWQVRHAGDRWYSHNYDGSPVFKLIVTARKLNGCEKSSAEIIKTEHRDFRGKNSSYFACSFLF